MSKLFGMRMSTVLLALVGFAVVCYAVLGCGASREGVDNATTPGANNTTSGKCGSAAKTACVSQSWPGGDAANWPEALRNDQHVKDMCSEMTSGVSSWYPLSMAANTKGCKLWEAEAPPLGCTLEVTTPGYLMGGTSGQACTTKACEITNTTPSADGDKLQVAIGCVPDSE